MDDSERCLQSKKLDTGIDDEDYGDDEYLDNTEDADLGDILTLPRQRAPADERGGGGDADDVSIASDDVTPLNDDDDVITADRKSSVVDQMRDDFENFCKMRIEKEKFKVFMEAHG